MLFKGSGVALVTPFDEDGGIDFDELGRLVDFHLENKTDAIIVTGTTGEASTLTEEEHLACIDYTVSRVKRRIPVIAGTGSNSTSKTIDMSKKAESLGVDGVLVVTPYYNKPVQSGLKSHFLKVADSLNIPMILYAVPSRTGVNLEPETVYELSQHFNIVGLKDATGNLSYTGEVARLCGKDFAIYSGNDDIILPVLSVGGVGVISVLANCMPRETHDMVGDFFQGEIERAICKQLRFKRFIDRLFIESNPIPVKYALCEMGFKTENLRLPLDILTDHNRTILRATMSELGLI